MRGSRCSSCRDEIERGRVFCNCGAQMEPLQRGYDFVSDVWHHAPPLVVCGRRYEDVVGESYRQGCLERAARGRTSRGGVRQWVMAQLVPEPTNPYDSKAVMVLVGREHVGYIPADSTGPVHRLLAAAAGRPTTVLGQLVGGWYRPAAGFTEEDIGSFGIRLWLRPDLRLHDPAIDGVLPAMSPVTFKLWPDAVSVATSLVGRKVAGWVQTDGSKVWVGVPGTWLGTLTDEKAAEVAPLIGALGTGAISATVKVEAGKTGNPLPRVMLPDPENRPSFLASVER